MTKAHDQVIADEAAAEAAYQKDQKGKKVVKAEATGVERVKAFDLSPLAEDAPAPAGTVAVQASLMDAESKKVFEALIVEIRKQLAGGGGGGTAPEGGVSQADFDGLKATVVADLNSLRDSIMLTHASLDADAGVATTTFAELGDPPPITTV